MQLVLLAGGLMLLAGCETERTITVTSDPSGALVHLNDVEVGRTPVTVPFTFYGVYDVRLEREGCQPLWTEQKADAPWWEMPGPDLVAMLTPDPEVHLDWHFELEQATPPEEVDPEILLDHARQLEALMDQKQAESAE